jgi:hypothetical protein
MKKKVLAGIPAQLTRPQGVDPVLRRGSRGALPPGTPIQCGGAAPAPPPGGPGPPVPPLAFFHGANREVWRARTYGSMVPLLKN